MTTAALSSAANPAARPGWYRTVAAVLAGLIVNAVLSSGTDMLLVALNVFPPLRDFGHPEAFSDSLLALALLYRTGFGILGCYVTARLAPRKPMAHALGLGGIGFLIGVVGAVATWGTWTSWYSLAIIAVTLPSAWLGGRLAQSRARS
jgi:hypothetical protein